MKYDLIVCGGGPGGLTAAWTAAKDGLKVALIERKKDISEVNRLCGQFTNINMISVGGKDKYAYSEPVHLEVGTHKTSVHFPGPGFSIEYNGALRPYYNYIHFSPSGYRVYREKDRFIAFFWEKESLLVGLLDSVLKAGVEVLTETISLSAENTVEGVKVSVRDKSGERTVEARKAIDAQGRGSSVAASLGMGQKVVGNQVIGTAGYVLEGVETEYRMDSWLCITVPELSRINFWLFMVAGDRNVLGTGSRGDPSALELTNEFMKLPYFEPWFRHARIVKTLAAGGPAYALVPYQEPIAVNVLLLGEAAGLHESSNPGAIACGYQAAKAVLKELNGQAGYQEYTAWWQKAFEGNYPTYKKAAARYGVMNALCTNEEVDYIYHLLEDQVGVPSILLGKNLERIMVDRPELYDKLKRTGINGPLEKFTLDVSSPYKTGELSIET